jgi:hypothetical protein
MSAGRLWRKQVLRVGDIDYRGRTLSFTGQYLTDLADAFGAGAVDLVPFLISDTHTNDPACYSGHVRQMEVVGDGLEAVIEVSAAADGTLRSDPQLDSAPRIIESYCRADGTEFSAVIQQILATRQSILTGLQPWEPVSG